MKRTSAILKMIKEEREKRWTPSTGLCTILGDLCASKLITKKEYDKVYHTLKRHKPPDHKETEDFYSLWWFPRDGKQRGEFLDKLIQKYSYKKK